VILEATPVAPVTPPSLAVPRTVTPPAPSPALEHARASEGGFRRLRADRFRLAEGFATGPGGWTRLRFEVGQRLLGLGGGGAAPIRAWWRRFELARRRREFGTLRALWWTAREPLRLVRDARRVVARHGDLCERRFGVPKRTQLRDLLLLRLRGVHFDTYYQNQLYRPERRRLADRFFQNHESMVLTRALAIREAREDFLLLEDKRRLERWLRARGIPTVETLGAWTDGSPDAGYDDPVLAVVAAYGRDLFSKPVDQSGGKGARRWRWDGAVWRDEQGAAYDPVRLVEAVAAESRGDARLLQRCVLNHPALAAVANGALCTARVLTARPPGGAPVVTNAAFRTGVGNASTDNLHRGGIAVAVDVMTGRLGTAVRADGDFSVVPMERHPDTGTPFAGFQLPDWEAARALVVRAHASLPAIGMVGWDVAFTPDGPLLVEGNFAPEPRLMQAPSGEPVAAEHLRILDAQLRHAYRRRDAER
jgi:hypothetical protein